MDEKDKRECRITKIRKCRKDNVSNNVLNVVMFIQLSLPRVKQNKNNITIVINLVFTTQVCKKTVRFKMFVDCVNKGLVSFK